MGITLISIIIPVYKVESYICRCLEAVLCQTYRNIEVILVDDCSPDRSMEIAKSIIESSSFSYDLSFKYLSHTHNRGLSAARNTGMLAANGDYIYFLDSDDEITKDCIELLAEPIARYPYDFVTGHYEARGTNVQFSRQVVKGELYGVRNIAYNYGNNFFHCMAWNKLCNADFLRNNNLFFKEGLIHEDELWCAQLASTAESMFFVDKTTYFYYIREGSIMSSENINNNFYHFQTILKSYYKYLDNKKNYFTEFDIIENRIKGNLINFMNSMQLSSYDKYAVLRGDYSLSWKILNIKYNSVRYRIKHLDEYLPIEMGYVYKNVFDFLITCVRQMGSYKF